MINSSIIQENYSYPYFWIDGAAYYPIYWNFQTFQENQPVQFFRNQMLPSEPKKEEQSQIQNNPTDNETNKAVKVPRKNLSKKEKKKKKIKDALYSKNRDKKIKPKKIYSRNQDRNIVPNIINKLFSYLGTKSKSMESILKFVKHNAGIYGNISPALYYAYLKQLRTALSRFLVEDDLAKLFKIHRNIFYLFDEKSQARMIGLSIHLLRQYYFQNQHIISLFNSKRVTQNKKTDYLKHFRNVQKQIEHFSDQFIAQYGNCLIKDEDQGSEV